MAILGQDWVAKTLPLLRESAAENLRHAKQLQVHPSSTSSAAFQAHCKNVP